MPDEIFNNPTVKTVIFQIQFPNLFYLEQLIGEYQQKIMSKFPQSSLILTKGLFISVGQSGKMLPESQDENSTKIWQFSTENDVKLNLQTNSLDISSAHHKTYNMGDGEKFRDIIQFAVDQFFSLVHIPVISRIGLRYIDYCPIVKKDNETYLQYYNTCFPLTRFTLDSANSLDFIANVKRGEFILTYRETAITKDNEFKLILDFDGIVEKIKPEDYLSVTDRLHDLIAEEFDKTAKEPLKEYMRR